MEKLPCVAVACLEPKASSQCRAEFMLKTTWDAKEIPTLNLNSNVHLIFHFICHLILQNYYPNGVPI